MDSGQTFDLDQTCGKKSCPLFCFDFIHNGQPATLYRCACGPGQVGFKRKRAGILDFRQLQRSVRGRRRKRATPAEDR